MNTSKTLGYGIIALAGIMLFSTLKKDTPEKPFGLNGGGSGAGSQSVYNINLEPPRFSSIKGASSSGSKKVTVPIDLGGGFTGVETTPAKANFSHISGKTLKVNKTYTPSHSSSFTPKKNANFSSISGEEIYVPPNGLNYSPAPKRYDLFSPAPKGYGLFSPAPKGYGLFSPVGGY